MATPFISVLEPTSLGSWDAAVPPKEQRGSNIPRTFRDAMEVRDQVYVQEQKVPRENEFDEDDSRSVHWVIYASVNQVVEQEIRDTSTGEVIRPRRSESRAMPIGTLRLVPFPHPPHPRKGGVYLAGRLVNAGDPVAKEGELKSGNTSGSNTPPLPPTTSTSTIQESRSRSQSQSGSTTSPTTNQATANQKEEEQQKEVVQPLSASETRRLSTVPALLPFVVDPPTVYHDGLEPYVKLGRLAVIKEFRGRGIAGQLIRAATDWMREHKTYFNPSPTAVGFEQLGMTDSGAAGGRPRDDVPKWQGLFCCHAQEDAVKVWEKHGFRVDDAMGRWVEEGIPHVGMFMRVSLG